MDAFQPGGPTVNIDVTSSSQAVKVTEARTTQVRVMNNGTATGWIAFGKSDVAATLAASIPVGPGVTEVQTAPMTDGSPIYAAAIAAGSTGKIYFTPGQGL